MPPPESDILEIIQRNQGALIALRHKRICVVGGSGFIGSWISNALIQANLQLGLELQISITGRDLAKARARLIPSEIGTIKFISTEFGNEKCTLPESDLYFHSVTPSSVPLGESYDEAIGDVTRNATNAIFESINPELVTTVIHLSSGAVYGVQDLSTTHICETPVTEERVKLSNYGRIKLETEKVLMSKSVASKGMLKVSNPRLFAFLGPLLPLDTHFAAGNFMNNLIKNENILVNGNPETKRSYLYPTDLISGLIRIAAAPTSESINLGSETITTIGELANRFSEYSVDSRIMYQSLDSIPSNYVPCTKKFSSIFEWKQEVELSDAIYRWYKWVKSES
jgi:dTDP-glucose 4,6-dehydratase